MSYIEYVTADHRVENPLPELARTNRFTMADLDQNRNGKISDTQWTRLLFRALQPLRYTGATLLGWLLFCYAMKTFVPGIILMYLSVVKGYGMAFVGAVTLACVGAFLVSVIKSAHTTALLLVDVKLGKAACIEGRVLPSREDHKAQGTARLYGAHGEKHTNYWYVVKDEYFEVDQAAHAALPDAIQCRLYHTPKSKLLLSIEPK